MVAIGVDIGGTSIRIGTVTKNGILSAFEKKLQKDVLSNKPLDGLADFISEYIKKNDLNGKVAGLTVGLPAPLNKEKTVVLNAPNIKGFDGKNVKEFLSNSLLIPSFLAKDVSVLFYYDIHRFKISSSGVTIACYIGTGIGNAIYIDGKLFDGSHGAAGELGHIPMKQRGEEICGCGNDSCAELWAGGKYLSNLQKEKFPNTTINNIFIEHAEHPLIAEYLEHLSIPIASEINILDPDVIILGGGVISMEGFPVSKLEKAIRRHSRKPLPEQELKFVISGNSGENGVIGAGIYTWEQIEGIKEEAI